MQTNNAEMFAKIFKNYNTNSKLTLTHTPTHQSRQKKMKGHPDCVGKSGGVFPGGREFTASEMIRKRYNKVTHLSIGRFGFAQLMLVHAITLQVFLLEVTLQAKFEDSLALVFGQGCLNRVGRHDEIVSINGHQPAIVAAKIVVIFEQLKTITQTLIGDSKVDVVRIQKTEEEDLGFQQKVQEHRLMNEQQDDLLGLGGVSPGKVSWWRGAVYMKQQPLTFFLQKPST